ncbi:MAG: hypothetical protein A2W91_19260 [Bacteroidetes bacterium GWF2_38_335]|nr:MAG: hypothetical protein A2W91_19260 [Bacteroidetes bacterium GWF2_38_335]OFY79898.1 MAG: hypothetical protein A2281_10660 [Bacteroidetes bacterium RIFOXYA12_FULL_38_20]HBS86354.1 hypothetical protein [Bacteroidales bacterium]
MKNRTLFNTAMLIILFIIASMSVNSQRNTVKIPPSFSNPSINAIDVVELPKPDMSQIKILDDENEKNGQMHVIARSVYADLDMENSGEWTYAENGDKIWRLKIICRDAKALGVYFSDFYLPFGSELFMYDEAGKKILHMDYMNNPSAKVYVNDLVKGDAVTLEYVESPMTSEKPVLVISEVAYAYREVGFLYGVKEFGDSESCEVNINCPEGANHQDRKQGVARLLTKDGDSYGWCSGTMVNNGRGDCIPYFLTANHCGPGATEADFQAWRFYFNYEAADCTSPASEPSYDLSTGCKLVSYGSQSSGSDFFLVKLNYLIPVDWNIYYNGWNNVNSTSSSGVSIHHPAGDIKKISTYSSNLVSSTWTGIPNTHWRVVWASTATDHGVTEGGSSGSPLFDLNGRVNGTLTGGGSFCTSPSQPDYYGKFSYHWLSNGTADNKRLKPWLDPDDSGLTVLDGKYCPAPVVTADFIADVTSIAVGAQVNFTNLSWTFPTKSYDWDFEGGTPSSSVVANKTVTYNTAGVYDVQLMVTSVGQTDTELKVDYITVGGVDVPEVEGISVKTYPNPTSNRFFVESHNPVTQISIYDTFGRLITNISTITVNNKLLVDISNLADGIYVVEIQTNTDRIIKRITLAK